MVDLNTLRCDKALLLSELQAAGAEIRNEGREIKCPFHEDRTASAGVYEDGGVWKYKCQAASCGVGGDVVDVIAASTRRSVTDVLKDLNTKHAAARAPVAAPAPAPAPPEQKQHPTYATLEKLTEAVAWSAQDGRIAASYIYTHPETKHHDMVVFRIEKHDGKKSFRQAHHGPDGYVMRGPEGLLPLYNRARIAGAAAVVVVEGEKCVHALHEIGIVATTSPGGAGKARHADWSPLKGKTAYLWPDADPPDPKNGRRTGIEHMREVAEVLANIADVRWIECDGLGLAPKGDCVDYIASFGSGTNAEKRLAIEAVLEFAKDLGPAGELHSEVEAAIAGQRTPIAWPWITVSNATRALLPGTLTILCGPPGSTKSLWLLEALAYWHERGVRIAVLELEEQRVYHLQRAVAQRLKNAAMTRGEWQTAHPVEARAAVAETKTFANSFGRTIFSAPLGSLTPDVFIEWMRARAAAGARIIAVDPITCMEGGDKQWQADHRVVIAAHQIATEYDASVILVTHPRKGQKGAAGNKLDDMAGGATYQRFSQTIVLLTNLPEPKSGDFGVTTGRTTDVYNRVLEIHKARNSWGQWKKVGFEFNAETFCSRECGLLITE